MESHFLPHITLEPATFWEINMAGAVLASMPGARCVEIQLDGLACLVKKGVSEARSTGSGLTE